MPDTLVEKLAKALRSKVIQTKGISIHSINQLKALGFTVIIIGNAT